MRLGGTIFACVGIVIVVLVANGRWPNVWNAMLAITQPASASSGTVITSAGGGTVFGTATGAQPGIS